MKAPSKPLRTALVISLFIGMIPLAGMADLELHKRNLAARNVSAQESYNLPPSRFLRATTFGYNELAADMIWIRTINYFTSQQFSKKELLHLKKYLDTIIALDPKFKAIYTFGPAMLLGIKGSKHTDEEVHEAIQVVKTGVEHFPEDWTFPKMLGSYYLFELKGKDEEERGRYKRIGAEWIRRAALLGAKSAWLTSLAAKVLTEQGQRDLAIQHLQEMYMHTQRDDVRREIRLRLKALKEEKLAADLESAGASFVERYKASPYKFLNSDLFVLTGLAQDQQPLSLK